MFVIAELVWWQNLSRLVETAQCCPDMRSCSCYPWVLQTYPYRLQRFDRLAKSLKKSSCTASFCSCPLSVFPRPSRLLLPIGAVWFRGISNSISVLYIQVPTSVLPSIRISEGVRCKLVKSTKHPTDNATLHSRSNSDTFSSVEGTRGRQWGRVCLGLGSRVVGGCPGSPKNAFIT
jgi:hypothetical protein